MVLGNPNSGPRYDYAYDAQGNVVAVTDSSGNVVASYAYDAFGNLTSSSETFQSGWSNPFRYIGAQGVRYDTETGLYWMSVRAYDPTLGRFISHDPLGRLAALGVSIQPYVYAANNPVNYTDPAGLLIIANGGDGGISAATGGFVSKRATDIVSAAPVVSRPVRSRVVDTTYRIVRQVDAQPSLRALGLNPNGGGGPICTPSDPCFTFPKPSPPPPVGDPNQPASCGAFTSVACTGHYDDSGIFSLDGLDTTAVTGTGRSGATTLYSIVSNAKSSGDSQFNFEEVALAAGGGAICGGFAAMISTVFGGIIGGGVCASAAAIGIAQEQQRWDAKMGAVMSRLTDLEGSLPSSGKVVVEEHYSNPRGGLDWMYQDLSVSVE